MIDLQGLFRTAALGWLSGCKRRFGMTESRELAHIFYTHQVGRGQNCTHIVDYYLETVQAVGASDGKAEFLLPQDSEDDESIKN